MKAPKHHENRNGSPALTTRQITEAAERRRIDRLLDEQHSLGSRRPKGRSLYQVICRQNQWVGVILWTGACWHLKARDQRIGWDPVRRSERLQLVVNQARFLVLEEHREPNLASQILGAAVRDLPDLWEATFGYRPLLAETFTDPESHSGTCYKAAGWEAVGMSGRDGRHYAEKFPGKLSSKKIWIKALVPNAVELLCGASLPAFCQSGVAAHAAARSALTSRQLVSIFEAFREVRDPRSRKARRYPLAAVLAIISLALLRGAVHVSAMVRTAQKLSQNQRRELRLPCKKGTRFRSVPCYDVFREVLTRVDLEALATVLTQWLQSHAGELPRVLAVDGKTIRDHLGLIVAVVDTEDGAAVAVAANPLGKGHELKTTQKLLRSDPVNLINATVTADSLHCQDESAHIVTREKGGDYVWQIRDNQPKLHALAKKQLEKASPLFLQAIPAMDGSKCGP